MRNKYGDDPNKRAENACAVKTTYPDLFPLFERTFKLHVFQNKRTYPYLCEECRKYHLTSRRPEKGAFGSLPPGYWTRYVWEQKEFDQTKKLFEVRYKGRVFLAALYRNPLRFKPIKRVKGIKSTVKLLEVDDFVALEYTRSLK